MGGASFITHLNYGDYGTDTLQMFWEDGLPQADDVGRLSPLGNLNRSSSEQYPLIHNYV